MSDTATTGRWVPVTERMPGKIGWQSVKAAGCEQSAFWNRWEWRINGAGGKPGPLLGVTEWFDADAAPPTDPLQQAVAEYLARRAESDQLHEAKRAAERASGAAEAKVQEALKVVAKAFDARYPDEPRFLNHTNGNEVTVRLLNPPK